MVDSVNRNNAVAVPTQTEALKEIEKTNPVSQGYESKNSVSVRSEEGQVDLPPVLQRLLPFQNPTQQ